MNSTVQQRVFPCCCPAGYRDSSNITENSSPKKLLYSLLLTCFPSTFVEAFWNLVNCPELNKSIRDLLKIKFTPSREERYSFYFTKDVLFFSSHWEKGMEGVIEVVS